MEQCQQFSISTFDMPPVFSSQCLQPLLLALPVHALSALSPTVIALSSISAVLPPFRARIQGLFLLLGPHWASHQEFARTLISSLAADLTSQCQTLSTATTATTTTTATTATATMAPDVSFLGGLGAADVDVANCLRLVTALTTLMHACAHALGPAAVIPLVPQLWQSLALLLRHSPTTTTPAHDSLSPLLLCHPPAPFLSSDTISPLSESAPLSDLHPLASVLLTPTDQQRQQEQHAQLVTACCQALSSLVPELRASLHSVGLAWPASAELEAVLRVPCLPPQSGHSCSRAAWASEGGAGSTRERADVTDQEGGGAAERTGGDTAELAWGDTARQAEVVAATVRHRTGSASAPPTPTWLSPSSSPAGATYWLLNGSLELLLCALYQPASTTAHLPPILSCCTSLLRWAAEEDPFMGFHLASHPLLLALPTTPGLPSAVPSLPPTVPPYLLSSGVDVN